MGTDIHGVLQVKEGDKWVTKGDIYDWRNYRLFAALADVRNGTGFAGVPTHVPIDPISEPRGWPDDLDYEEDPDTGWGRSEDRELDGRWLGDHSFSWLSLDEVANWPGWDQQLAECGYVRRAQFDRWDRKGPPPDGWSGGIWGRDIKAVDERHLDGVDDDWTHVRCYWSRPLRDACSEFLEWVEEAKKETEGREARIVFGFDS